MIHRSQRPDVVVPDASIAEYVFAGLKGREDQPALIDGMAGRVMTGADGQPHYSGWEADAFSSIAAYNVVVEHCTFMWGLDENMSASGPRFAGKTVAEWRRNTSHNIVFRENLAA